MIGNLDSAVPEGPIEGLWNQHKFDMKLVAPNNRRKFEIIIVGSGLAGASAAATQEALAGAKEGSTLGGDSRHSADEGDRAACGMGTGKPGRGSGLT